MRLKFGFLALAIMTLTMSPFSLNNVKVSHLKNNLIVATVNSSVNLKDNDVHPNSLLKKDTMKTLNTSSKKKITTIQQENNGFNSRARYIEKVILAVVLAAVGLSIIIFIAMKPKKKKN